MQKIKFVIILSCSKFKASLGYIRSCLKKKILIW